MVSQEDRESLGRAIELVREVIAHQRDKDLRAVSVLVEAVRDIRIGTRYLDAFTPPSGHAA